MTLIDVSQSGHLIETLFYRQKELGSGRTFVTYHRPISIDSCPFYICYFWQPKLVRLDTGIDWPKLRTKGVSP